MSNCINNPNIIITDSNAQKVISPQSPTSVSGSDEKVGRWSKEEHSQFLKGLDLYGREWKKISHLIPSRTVVQVRTHAQKYFHKLHSGKTTPTNSPKTQPSQSMPNTPILSSAKVKTSPVSTGSPINPSLSNGSILSLKNLNLNDSIPKSNSINNINRVVYTNHQIPLPSVNNILSSSISTPVVPLSVPPVNDSVNNTAHSYQSGPNNNNIITTNNNLMSLNASNNVNNITININSTFNTHNNISNINNNISQTSHRSSSSRSAKNAPATINPSHLLQSVLYSDVSINKNSYSPRTPGATDFLNGYANSNLSLLSGNDNRNGNNDILFTPDYNIIDGNAEDNGNSINSGNTNNNNSRTGSGLFNPYTYNSMGSLNTFINNVNNIKNGNCFSNTNTIYADSSSSSNSLFSPINHSMFPSYDMPNHGFSLDHSIYDNSFSSMNDNEYQSFNFRTQEDNIFSFDRDLHELLRHNNDDECF